MIDIGTFLVIGSLILLGWAVYVRLTNPYREVRK